LATMLAIVITGCRSKEGEGGGKTSEKKLTGKLVIWNLYDPQSAFKGQMQGFASKHPKVKMEYRTFQNETEYERLLINEIAEGSGPDVFALPQDWMPRHRKLLIPAPPELIVPEKFRENFFDVTADVLIADDEDGKEQVWGLPLFVDTLAVYYNKSLLRDGLLSTSKPGVTWADIKEQVFKLSEKDNSVERFKTSGIALGRADNIGQFGNILLMILVQHHIDLWNKDESKSAFARGQGSLLGGDGREFYPGRATLDLFTQFALPSYKHYSWSKTMTSLYPQQKEIGVFARGKLAMMFGFASTREKIEAARSAIARNGRNTIANGEIGVAAAPQFVEPDEKNGRDSLADFYFFGVNKHSKNPLISWKFVDYLASTDSAQEYFDKTGKPTARFDLIEDQVTDKKAGVFARQTPFAKVLRVYNREAFFEILAVNVQEILASKATVKTAANRIEKQLTCLLKREQRKDIDVDCLAIK